jgi:DNA helicase-2/ATP-dependent DNA helicase PcrA
LFLKFQGEFDGVCVINLEQNYRSSPSIVKSSLSLVEHNKKRIPIKLSSNIVEDHPVEVIRCGNEKDEAKFIVSEIEKIVGGTTLLHIDSGILDQKEDSQEYQFSDFAVLYRKNAFVRYLEGEFLHRGIPYQIIGKDSFWQFKEVREVISLLKDLARTKTFISDKFNLSKLIEDHIQKSYKGDSQVSENMKKFMELVGEFEYASIWELLSQIALLSRETYIDRRANCVKLMTLHQAKGLEFENVFIAGVEEGFVPLLRVGCPSDDLEEERRLLYVGMTRAKKRLYLTYARNRLIWGKREKRLMSRFIHEIDEGTTRFKEFIRQRKKKDQMKLF